MKKKKDENPILKYSAKMSSLDLPLDVRVFLSILFSTACRPSEAVEYKVKRIEGDIVYIELPIKKKRKKVSRVIPISTKLFSLTIADFTHHQKNLRSLKTYNRWTKKITKQSPRSYRHELAIYVLKKKNIQYVRDMLCHTDIRTTQHYLVEEKSDFLEIASL